MYNITVKALKTLFNGLQEKIIIKDRIYYAQFDGKRFFIKNERGGDVCMREIDFIKYFKMLYGVENYYNGLK